MKIDFKNIFGVFNICTLISLLIILYLLQGCNDAVINNNGPSGYNFTDYQPDWSPDGSKIVYIHQDTLASLAGIYIIDTSGSNKRSILQGYENNPSWSPSGNWIAFSNMGQIYIIKQNGDSLTQLTFSGNNFYPAWSNDGDWIAFDSNENSPTGRYFIWKMKNDGSQKIRIGYDTTNGEMRKPHWQNNKICLIKYFAGSNGLARICLMDTNGTNVQEIVNNSLNKDFPKLTVDGSKITFTVVAEGPKFQVWTINSDGSDLKQLTGSLFDNSQAYSSTWSPNGEDIAYTNSAPDNGKLWIMKKDGTNRIQVTF